MKIAHVALWTRNLDAQVAFWQEVFGGQSNELWCEGGEIAFLKRMAAESKDVASQVLWFSSLVAKREHLADLHRQLSRAGALEVREVAMAQGSKQSRFVAWTFHAAARRAGWPAR